ncbi:MAG TPA: clostripain-related cysteine peptidase, partial [Candidatus Limnocylindria bacterium]|nr:clostripain-related cysteine peptidase [Candidatus Limnocylindria bacterium]
MRKPLAWLLLCALAFAIPALGEAAPAGGRYGTQTIMVYMIGSDLESGGGLATSDISEMLRSRPDASRVNVVVMTGGSQKWMTPRISAGGIGVYHIQGRSPAELRVSESASMGEASTLSGFLEYAVGAFPADSYGLILWDHAGGPMVGFGMDTLYRNDALTMPELRQALRASPFGEGGLRLEWVAFDACLMGS